MATRVVTELHDDIDGSDATQTDRFAVDGIKCEIDLSDRNANRLRDCFEEFVGHARKVDGGRGPKLTASAPADKSQTAAMRAWLMEHATRYPSEAGFLTGCSRSITTVTD
jgi:Lsr2